MMKTMIKFLACLLVGSSLLVAGGLSSCTGCHGSHFEKVALGKSKVVKDMSQEEIVATLKGYRDGTYGGSMKGVMKNAVSSLSDAQIEQMAQEIKAIN